MFLRNGGFGLRTRNPRQACPELHGTFGPANISRLTIIETDVVPGVYLISTDGYWVNSQQVTNLR